MKTFHINHDKLRLIIFFLGFYTDESCLLPFDNGASDILFVYDYSNLNKDVFLDFDFTPYTEINLIAYSYGVFAANEMADCLPPLNNSAAVAGTIFPIDENYGIKPKIYDLMLNSFNEATIANFKAKMEANSNGIIHNSKRSVENLKSELFYIKNYTKTHKIAERLNFDKVIITKNDKIFPYKSQINFWAGHNNLIETNSGHFPFFDFNSLEEIF